MTTWTHTDPRLSAAVDAAAADVRLGRVPNPRAWLLWALSVQADLLGTTPRVSEGAISIDVGAPPVPAANWQNDIAVSLTESVNLLARVAGLPRGYAPPETIATTQPHEVGVWFVPGIVKAVVWLGGFVAAAYVAQDVSARVHDAWVRSQQARELLAADEEVRRLAQLEAALPKPSDVLTQAAARLATRQQLLGKALVTPAKPGVDLGGAVPSFGAGLLVAVLAGLYLLNKA